MNYPNGLKKKQTVSITTHKNRGMTLENELNISNEYYREIDKAYIYNKHLRNPKYLSIICPIKVRI